MNKKENGLTHKTGTRRNLKSDPAIFRHTISLNEEQNAAFLGRFDESGMKVKAHFITACIFDKAIRVVKQDKAVMDYYIQLITFHSQFRAIGANYNQAVKSIKIAFEEKKALYYLAKLEKATLELVVLNRQIIDLTDKLEVRMYGFADTESTKSDFNLK